MIKFGDKPVVSMVYITGQNGANKNKDQNLQADCLFICKNICLVNVFDKSLDKIESSIFFTAATYRSGIVCRVDICLCHSQQP